MSHSEPDNPFHAALVAPGESVYLLGVTPPVPPGWTLEPLGDLAQMDCDRPLPVPAGPVPAPLDARDRDDVLALTALVYPHYFRERTMAMGRYLGIRIDGRLAAIAGERLGSGLYERIGFRLRRDIPFHALRRP